MPRQPVLAGMEDGDSAMEVKSTMDAERDRDGRDSVATEPARTIDQR